MSIKQRERGLSFYNQDIPEVEEDDESSSSEEEFDFDLPPPSVPPPPPPPAAEEPSVSKWLSEGEKFFTEGERTDMNLPENLPEQLTPPPPPPPSNSSSSPASSVQVTMPVVTETPTLPTKNRRSITRRRSSVMDIVGQFRRGSDSLKSSSLAKEREARKQRQTELAQLAPSDSPNPSPRSSPRSPTVNSAPGMREGNKNFMMGTVSPRINEDVISEWKEMQDPTSGHPYWWNSKTQESTWKNPNPTTEEEITTTLQKDWVQLRDEMGRVYWHNSTTNESSWSDPSSQSQAHTETMTITNTTSTSSFLPTTASFTSPVPSSNHDQILIARLQEQVVSLTNRLRDSEDKRLDETHEMSRRMSALINKSSNSISLEEHRKSMLAESERLSTLMNKLELKNDELYSELQQLQMTSSANESRFNEERIRWKNSSSAIAISMKEDQMSDMEDQLANSLSMLEKMKYATNQDKIHIMEVEKLLKEKTEECNEYKKKWEALLPKEISEEEKLIQHEQQMLEEKLKSQKENTYHVLVNCIEYFGSSGLRAIKEACGASSELKNVLIDAAARSYSAATEDTESSTKGENNLLNTTSSFSTSSTSSFLKKMIDDKLNEQEFRHRSEIKELEKTSNDALHSMARGWAEEKGRNGGGSSTTSLHGNRLLGNMVGQGPQVELFIWKAAMKHAEDLRKVQSAGHRESTKLRGSLAIEAETLADCARKTTLLHQALSKLQDEFNKQLHSSEDSSDSLSHGTPSPITSNTTPLILHRVLSVTQPSPLILPSNPLSPIYNTSINISPNSGILRPPGNMLFRELSGSNYKKPTDTAEARFRKELQHSKATTLHDFDNRSKPPPSNSQSKVTIESHPQPPTVPPPPVISSENIVSMQRPNGPPPPEINPMFNN